MIVAVVPAYNEAKAIEGVIKDLQPQVDLVVVVDDCSRDNTCVLAKKTGAVVLRHNINRGAGASLETGQAYARKVGADYVVHFDGDGQFDASDIIPALKHLQSSESDILFGSRYLDGRSQVPWTKRKIIHPLARLVNKIFAGISLSDAHNGFRILNRKAIENIMITQDRMAHASEIPFLAQRSNLKITEYPVKVTYRQYGQKISGGLEIIKDLVMGSFVK